MPGGFGLVLRALAQAEGQPVEVDADRHPAGELLLSRNEQHGEVGHHRLRCRAHVCRIRGHGNIPPAQDIQAFLGRDPADLRLGRVAFLLVNGHKGDSGRVQASRWQVETGHRTQQPIG